MIINMEYNIKAIIIAVIIFFGVIFLFAICLSHFFHSADVYIKDLNKQRQIVYVTKSDTIYLKENK